MEKKEYTLDEILKNAIHVEAKDNEIILFLVNTEEVSLKSARIAFLGVEKIADESGINFAVVPQEAFSHVGIMGLEDFYNIDKKFKKENE